MCQYFINKWLCRHESPRTGATIRCLKDFLPETRDLCIRTSKLKTRMKECSACASYYKKHGKPNPDAPRDWRRERRENKERKEAELESTRWIAEMEEETERLQKEMERERERLRQEGATRRERRLEMEDEEERGAKETLALVVSEGI